MDGIAMDGVGERKLAQRKARWPVASLCDSEIMNLVAAAGWDADFSADERERALDSLEAGRIVYFPGLDFSLREAERRFLDPSTVKQPRKHGGRARVIFFPDSGKSYKIKAEGEAKQAMEAMVARYAAAATGLVKRLFPDYADALEIGPTTYRPYPRTSVQGLHVDSFFLFPTEGKRVMRLFTNVNPAGRPRVWQVGDAFEPFSRKFLPRVKREIPGSGWLLENLHITRGRRTPYDHAMRQLRNLCKRDRAYQQDAPRQWVEFPSGSSWIVYPDARLHGAATGQFAFEQTFFLPVEAMRDPGRSPLRQLERHFGRALA
jgi:hypothetical protein